MLKFNSLCTQPSVKADALKEKLLFYFREDTIIMIDRNLIITCYWMKVKFVSKNVIILLPKKFLQFLQCSWTYLSVLKFHFQEIALR